MLLVYKVGGVVENCDRAPDPVYHALTRRCRTQSFFKKFMFWLCDLYHTITRRNLSLPAHFYIKQIYNNYGWNRLFDEIRRRLHYSFFYERFLTPTV